MRKLLALAIVIILANVAQSWAMLGLGDIKFDGSLEFGGYSANNEQDFDDDDNTLGANASDHRGELVTRQRLGINGGVTEESSFRIELGRNTGQFGKSLATTGGEGQSNNLQQEQENIYINNAYLDIRNIIANISARIGRQYVGNAGDLVWNFSPTDDNHYSIPAIDGVLLQHRGCKLVQTDLFLGKLRENDDRGDTNDGDSSATDSDTNLSSLDFVFPNLVPGARLNAGYLWGVQENTDNSSDNNTLKTYRAGINGGVMENRLTYRAEFFQNAGGIDSSGMEMKYEGNAIDLGLGFNIPEGPGGGWGFNANLLMASGDGDTGDDKDESFHDFSALGSNSSDRLMGDIFGKSNTLGDTFGNGAPLGQGADTSWTDGGGQGAGLQVMNLGVSYTPVFCPRSTLSLNWYSFGTSEDGVNSASPNADKYADEIDFALNFRQSANVNWMLGYAMLSPDDALLGQFTTFPVPAGTADDDITQLSMRLTVKWGDMGGGMTQIDPVAE